MDVQSNSRGIEAKVEEQFVHGTKLTSSHYVSTKDRPKCKNSFCSTSFVYPSIRRPHHCRRCGEVFCRRCLQNRRRLNVMAQPDPLGTPCKVCVTCFDERVLSLGCTTRSLTADFVKLRQQSREEMRHIEHDLFAQSYGPERPSFWKEQFKIDTLKECLRLLDGFKASAGESETLKTVSEIWDHVNVPLWQRSKFWTLESSMVTCRECGGRLGRRKMLRNCRVCGLALCKICTNMELLLYFDDDVPRDKYSQPKLAIIRIKGSPEIEPRLSLLLYCCRACKEEITEKQIENEQWYMENPKPPDFNSELVRMDAILNSLTEDINKDIEKLSTLLDRVEITRNEGNLSELSVTRLLKDVNQCDQKQIEQLQDAVQQTLKSFWDIFTGLKDLLKINYHTVRGSHLQLAKNCLHARNEFYITTKSRFGKLTRQVIPGNT